MLHSKKTHEDYIGEAFKLCVKIHKRLPDGNVLVFLTGKREILDLCKKLNDEFSGNNYMAHQIEKEEKIDIKKAVKETESKKEERVFAPEDTIPCRSLVSGGLYIEGSISCPQRLPKSVRWRCWD